MSAAACMMGKDFEHIPVLLDQVIEMAGRADPGVIVDCTLGGAGHAKALLKANPTASLIGLDRDADALRAAGKRLRKFEDRVTTVHAPFSDLPQLLKQEGWARPQVLLADLGVSSHQLDTADRGFSFRSDGPLDMRMDPSTGISAQELIATSDEATLADLIRRYGEERHAKRVARAIIEAQPETTNELAAAIRKVVRKSKDGIDPATRTFQGLRIAVNGELQQLDALLGAIPDILDDGGVALLISFHSLEDRAVKRAFRRASRHAPPGPGGLPPAVDLPPTLELLTTKPIVASDEEAATNRRARSAKLRVARRLPRRDDEIEGTR